MRRGVCIKCGQATVYSGRDVPVKHSTGNTVPINFQHRAALDNYVCTTCGYVERYISDPKALSQIESEWSEAGKSKRR